MSEAYISIESATIKVMPYGLVAVVSDARFYLFGPGDRNQASTMIYYDNGQALISRYWLNQTINWFKLIGTDNRDVL